VNLHKVTGEMGQLADGSSAIQPNFRTVLLSSEQPSPRSSALRSADLGRFRRLAVLERSVDLFRRAERIDFHWRGYLGVTD
jgi:hypothetical protein